MRRSTRSIIIIFVIFYFIVGTLTLFFAKNAITDGKKATGAIKLQDLDATKAYLKDTKNSLKKTQMVFYTATPLRIIPLLGWYVADIQRGLTAAVNGVDAALTLTDAVTPYADVLGLKGQGTFLGGTAQERIGKAIETLSKVTPQLEEVGASLHKSRVEMDKIQSWRYPNILPKNPGQKIDTAKKGFQEVESLVVDTRPLLEVLPQVMGADSEKKYLVLFQNDKELRATGGFITAYAFFRVNRGVIETEGSSDIYNLDNTLLKKVAAPEPIVKYLPGVNQLNLRDSNLQADYLASMRQFEQLYNSTQDGKKIDGIIALDTQFVLKMLQVLGSVEAYGSKFTTDKVDSCACPQIIWELERYADQPVAYEKGERKGIIGVLMQQMMDKAFNAPKSTWPHLLGAVTDSLREKHLLLYFHDSNAQAAAERINFAGRVASYDGDYLYINETNFAGAKSNLYVQEKVKQTVKKGKDGNLEKVLTLEYKYPHKMDDCSLERKGGLCLAGIYRDWLRIYVPKGSKITKTSGLELKESEDLEKTLFDGFFELRPEGSLKIEINYTVPVKAEGTYKLLIQKQPGVEGHTYEIDAFGHKERAFPLTTDKELIVKI
ncbi:hypothetical protein A2870_02625 [Candidatus Curtissbacteria bacterium RIFCSPHIGHO2_01_FULL_41_11]|uniref:DUF4012 domain-containing protein n=1 Tax=Candidatus Curtissbacteria bacterium RIFCSPHIGHO2_01_FULL_41_11 TaxID=1797711 RepID=A0A1F5G7X5_9BACT|nr:MAG: hypothetical protein A2870_02625 [Candidatus Curtissbacteria bacterium RIFCSPHIGHO2_01_FULL_41_11]